MERASAIIPASAMIFRITLTITSTLDQYALPRKPAAMENSRAPNDKAQRCISCHPEAEDQRRIVKIASAAQARPPRSGGPAGTGLGMKRRDIMRNHRTTKPMGRSCTSQSLQD